MLGSRRMLPTEHLGAQTSDIALYAFTMSIMLHIRIAHKVGFVGQRQNGS